MPELLQDWVSLQAARRPEAAAVVLGRESLSYGELERLSNRMARALKEKGCRRGDRVCLLMPKTPTAIACILGIYKADCVYVPLDTSSPSARLARIVASSGNRWILAAGKVTPLLEDLLAREEIGPGLSICWMDREPVPDGRIRVDMSLNEVMTVPDAAVERSNGPGDTAHLLFTSGSTGFPKGVVITHDNVKTFVEWGVKYFGMSAHDRVSGHPPLHFDLSVFDIFGAFASGAALHLVPPGLNVFPNKLVQWIRESRITQWFSVPSVLHYLARFDAVRDHDFPEMKRLLWCGEVLPTPTLIYWMRRLPQVTFTNLYGPTEATIASSYYTVPRCPETETAPVPIGWACGGESLHVLDRALEPVEPGAVGDLYIGGDGLSPGYWNDPEMTAEVFVRGPAGAPERIYKTGDLARVGEQGCVYFLGRADTQIKSRGYRIELGEIEAAAHSLRCLRECAVVAVTTEGFEGTEICIAYAPAEGCSVTPGSLREELKRLVPDYMIPTRWMEFDELPKNANGKTHRRKLKEAMTQNGVTTD